ncbi:MAG: sigma-70 family RNA polymerase sigma factor [Asticcacaulis sp.]|uniref:RNA polymerase sigma factor n=1 Tax=Asticcacaulis sp. TaxID=1872648 RepID=UPI0039E67A5A
MSIDRKTIVNWVAREVMPHERRIRSWLRRLQIDRDEIDDLIQEAYCNLSGLDHIAYIASPERYFFLTVKNILNDKYRRAKVVRIETMAEMDSLGLACDEPSPEQIISDRREWETVARCIRDLPARCRRIFELRKVHGLSQKHIAKALRISESTVENEGVKGMRLILQALRNDDETGASHTRMKYDAYRNSRRN